MDVGARGRDRTGRRTGERPRGRGRPAVATVGELLLVWGLLGAYVVGLARHGDGFEPFVDGWLGALSQLVPAAATVDAARREGRGHPVVPLLAAGMVAYAGGNVLFIAASGADGTLPFPSYGDLLYILFYPCAFAALLIAVRDRLRRVPRMLWLDSVLGGLGAATALSVPLGPVLAAVSGRPLQAVVAFAYPTADLLLVATVVAVVALRGWRGSRGWLLLAAGLLVFAGADTVYALRVQHGTYVVGTPLDALWALGLTVIATWAHCPRDTARVGVDVPAALAVPGLATGVAVVVLVTASTDRLSVPPVVLATATLVAAAGRTQLAFRQLRRAADLRRQARTDDLTGLANRRRLYDELDRLLERRPDRGDEGTGPPPCAVLLLDLDRFKEVNDSLGHAAGDELLVQVAQRLTTSVRDDDLLARLGGDEFALVLPDADRAVALTVAEHARDELVAPFLVHDVPVHVDVSIGVALSPGHGTDRQELLRCADVAMYAAKTARTGVEVHEPQRDQEGRGRLQLTAALREAVTGGCRGGRLVLHYQPQVDLRTRQVPSVEALVRWEHPTRGMLFPDTFLPLAEQTGLIRPLTATVLELALGQARTWREAGRELTVAVNLSASNLVDLTLPGQVAALLRAHRLPPGALALEITESVLMSDRTRSLDVLHALRALGVRLSVDDYGTGYSSLAYLRELPVAELKLDRSFVMGMDSDPHAAAIVRSTIGLAHALDLPLVAEGVETLTSLTELADAGCDVAQGYYLSRPLPAEELHRWLAEHAPAPPAMLPVP